MTSPPLKRRDLHFAGYCTITSKRHITIPKAVADAVGIAPKSMVVLTTHRKGTLSVRPATPQDLAALPYRGKPKEAKR